MMIRKKILLVALLGLPLLLPAQTIDNSARFYNVNYEKSHLFLQKGDDFNVVDYDVEWPSIICSDDVVPLKRFISQQVFDYATSDLDSALTYVNYVYGKPVEGKLKTIPDDNRFCYVKANAKILSYMPSRWITYSLEQDVDPQKLSPYKALKRKRVITYDLTQKRIMYADDMLRNGVLDWTMPSDFYYRLFAPLYNHFGYDIDVFNDFKDLQIDGVWIDNGNICMLVDASTDYENYSYTVSMPYYYSYVLTRNARRMVEKKLKATQPKVLTLPTTWKGDTIYTKVDKMPEFKGGTEGLKRYLSYVSKPEASVSKPSRVFVSFVVDKKGIVQQVSVISPVSPLIDEHAVSVIKGMPAFVPGEQNGKPVCVRLVMPVSYQP